MAHTVSGTGHGRRESRSVKTMAIAANLGGYVRGHWAIENSSHHVRDVVFAEDASTVHTGSAPRAMAAFRILAIGRLRLLGADNIAKTTRAIRDAPEHALWIWRITDTPLLPELEAALFIAEAGLGLKPP